MRRFQMRSHVPEIGGLRAIAVVAVLLFHAFPDLLPGGFIGVDVFFVVSGYVIARTYGKRLLGGESSLKDFYVKRIRRLAPVYAVVLAVTSCGAYLILEPDLLKSYGLSLLAQPFYLPNVSFWLEGDYFVFPTEKPLLHTWSLAVEEQFYLLFGAGILFGRWRPRWLLVGVVMLTLISIATGLVIGPVSPKTAFFLLPARIWEFTIGIGAWALAARLRSRPAAVGELVLAAASLVALLASVLAFTEESLFPGLQAFLACGSTAIFLVLFERRPSAAYGVLKTAPARRIGELSYGLYLWHWPLIALLTVYLGRPLGIWEASLMLVVSSGLAELTYRTVEDPIRRKRLIPSNPLLLRFWVVSSVVSVLLGYAFIATNGVLQRFDEPIRSLYIAAQDRSDERCSYSRRILYPSASLCPVNQPSLAEGARGGLLLLGDSHAKQLVPLVSELGNELGVPVYLSISTCDLDEYGQAPRCSLSSLKKTVREAQALGVQTIVATSYWKAQEPLYQTMEEPVRIMVASGAKVLLSEVVPHSPSLDPSVHATAIREGRPRPEILTREAYIRSIAVQRETFEALARDHPDALQILKPGPLLCGDEVCQFSVEGFPTHADESHLTQPGARLLTVLYRDVFAVAAQQ